MATAGSAPGTLVVASSTGWMAHKTSKMDTATEEDARASRESSTPLAETWAGTREIPDGLPGYRQC